MVVAQLLLASEEEPGPRISGRAYGIYHSKLPGRHIAPHLPVQREVDGHGEDPEVATDVPAELRLGTEDEVSHVGVQAVGADHEVEPASAGVLEGADDLVRFLDQRADRVAEDVLRALACGFTARSSCGLSSPPGPNPSTRSHPRQGRTGRSRDCPNRVAGRGNARRPSAKPYRSSQYANVGPAMLAPEINTSRVTITAAPAPGFARQPSTPANRR